MAGDRILIVDDERGIRSTLSGILGDEGYRPVAAGTGHEALARIGEEVPDLVILDIWLPEMDGIEVLAEVKRQWPELPVVMMSGHGTIETAVKATKLGAYDFVEKPLSLEKTLLVVERALEHARLERENRQLRERIERAHEIIGTSPVIVELRRQIATAAPTNGRVLIFGENGAGKELVARAIHALSARRDQTFVEVNCAAIPDELIESELFGHEKGAFTGATARRRGKFELATAGTIFLDEIGDMSLRTQAKVLRALEEQTVERIGGHEPIRVDVRVIAASNQALPDLITQGRFREDLFYRLNVIPVEVPPLRRRREDIPLLVEHFLKSVLGGVREALEDALGRSDGLLHGVRLARQRARAAQHGRAARHHDARRRHRARGSPAAAPGAGSRRGARRLGPPEPAGGPGRFRARVHPRGASGPRVEHHPDRPGARHRARQPLAEAQGLRHRGAPEGRGAHPARCLRPAGLPPWGAAGSSLPLIRSPPSPASRCCGAAAPPSTRPSPSGRRSRSRILT